MSQQLVRPTQGRMIAGVAAGIADRMGWSRTAVRLALVVSTVLPGPQFLVYLAGWILIPEESALEGSTSPEISH